MSPQVRYRSLTIHAVCANCGAETDNAEKEFESYHGETMFCKSCFDRIYKLQRHSLMGMTLASLVGMEVKAIDEEKDHITGKLTILKDGTLNVFGYVGIDARGADRARVQFNPEEIAEICVQPHCGTDAHLVGFWNNFVFDNASFVG